MTRALAEEVAVLAGVHADAALGALIGIATTGTSATARATAALNARGIARPLLLRLAIATLVGRTTAERHLLERGEAEQLAELPDVGEITTRLRPLAASQFAERGNPNTWPDVGAYSPAEQELLAQLHEEWTAAQGAIGTTGAGS